MPIDTRLPPLAFLYLLLGCGAPPSHAAHPAAPPPASPPMVSAASPAPASAAQSTGLGQIDFPISGSEGCAQPFRDGMLALHSFEYDRAHASFEAALAADHGCAMAAWGDAMAYVHPVWRERDLAKGAADRGRVVWIADRLPEEAAAGFGAIMDQGAVVMKSALERQAPPPSQCLLA